jgi:hypothetical protein
VPLKFEESLFQFLVSLSTSFLRATFCVPTALPSFLVQIFRYPRSFCLQAGAQSLSQPPAPWRGLADVAAQILPAFCGNRLGFRIVPLGRTVRQSSATVAFQAQQ